MILAFWRALFQAIAVGLITLGLITSVEFTLAGELAAIHLYVSASIGVAFLVLLVRFITLLRRHTPVTSSREPSE